MLTTFNMMDAKVVLAQFPNTPERDYAYFVPEGDDPQVGDVIMTSTSWDTFRTEHANPDYQKFALDAKLARVTDVLAGGHPKATRFYMQLISVERLKATHERNQEMGKRAKEVQAAYAELDKLLERRGRADRYRELAKLDPDAARLLAVVEGKTPVAEV